jgi:hypothetical protein
MRKIGKLAATMVAALSAFISAGAEAQSVRTFVSGHGSDTGICGVGSPCRTFAFALTQTAAGGEITVLDSAGYGTLTINHAVSITNEEGVEAAITVTSGDGITIAAGAGDVVNLTGITLTGGGGADGITFTSGGTLNIKNCVARGFNNLGLNLLPGASSQFNVSDTIVSNNRIAGISVQPAGAGTTTGALFERVQMIGNNAGMGVDGGNATGTLQATATNSDASGNGTGFAVGSLPGKAVTTLTVANSTVANNSFGLESTGATTMFVAGSTVSGNTTGFIIGSVSGSLGVIKTFGNNNITDTNNSGTLTKVSQQ